MLMHTNEGAAKPRTVTRCNTITAFLMIGSRIVRNDVKLTGGNPSIHAMLFFGITLYFLKYKDGNIVRVMPRRTPLQWH